MSPYDTGETRLAEDIELDRMSVDRTPKALDLAPNCREDYTDCLLDCSRIGWPSGYFQTCQDDYRDCICSPQFNPG